MYSCPPMPPAPCPPDCPPSKPKNDESSKYYREIGTEMIGNRLIIRMEREKGKSRKLKDWDPPCDCDVVIQRPTEKEGPKILKVADNNQILFRIESRSSLSKKDGNETMPQAVSYEVGQCKGGPNTNDQCRTITIYPVADSSGAQQVHTDRLTVGDQNVFLLKVKNKPDADDKPRKNVELEMRTPKPPAPPTPPSSAIKLPESEKVVPEVEEDCFQAAAPPPREKSRKRDKKRKKKKRK